ncbi:MAG: alkaline phosphatase family protein, partial [Candidatus Binatia bacterium]
MIAGCLAVAVVAAIVVASGCSSAPRDAGEKPESRVVVLGFDGVDPDLVSQWASDLPHIRKLMTEGSFRRLQTTTPPASCTAWSTFATGLDPGGHGIFDFIYRDPKTYLPDRTGAVSHKAEYLWGLFRTKRETFSSTMTGETFWKAADLAGVRSVVLRVPCIYPVADMEHGYLQGGLGAPDIRGSEGTFHFYTSALSPREASDPKHGGKVVSIGRGAESTAIIEGLANPLAEKFERLTIPITIRRAGSDAVEVEIQGTTVAVEVGRWSDWFRMSFEVTPFSSVSGMARFRLVATDPDIELFLSPINYDPADPAIKLTDPFEYARTLYDSVGDYKTVGWNHETWGLNEERIDEDAFMEDIFQTMAETEEITFHELDTRKAELFISVFVETDRTSHMMYRLLDEKHPRYDAELAARHGDSIHQTYRRMDEIVGKVMSRLGDDDLLLIVSDHGFHSWRRGFNVNSWLVQEGYMVLKGGKRYTDAKFLLDVDWSKTKAYALGVGSIYLNVRGREGKGIVTPGRERRQLAGEISAKLKQVVDPATGTRVVREVYLAEDTWSGGRMADAQDLQVGLASGYRVSSATPLGGAPEGLFEDNMKKWSGDHATTYTDITEGILISNRRIKEEEVSIIDLAPTILTRLGVAVPEAYGGKVLT